jgi:hypothetical protein
MPTPAENFKKAAEAMRTTENDPEPKTVKIHEDPPGRGAAGTLDAPWGEPPHEDPTHNGKAAWEYFMKDNPTLLGKAFDGFEASRKGEHAFVNQYFTGREHESRSPLLRKYAEEGNIPSDATLRDRVRSLFGRD